MRKVILLDLLRFLQLLRVHQKAKLDPRLKNGIRPPWFETFSLETNSLSKYSS
jgi:hypothetical protein